ncbi:hypothetical protein UY3_16115 [Chelonia mydas]|uniref:Uncharacterized protein n=1 Tax=Chelonia mydas TaxID=8469 RepID=M7B3W3_CHEMY|nr:hypothetical protein UY3_16115 [Chelonia mydas]
MPLQLAASSSEESAAELTPSLDLLLPCNFTHKGWLYQFCHSKQLPPNCRRHNSSGAAAELPPHPEERRGCYRIPAAGHGLPPHSECHPKHLLGKLVPGAGPVH